MDQNEAHSEQGVTPENNTENNNNMASLLAQEGLGIDFPKQGEIRTGMVASKTPGQILVSIGTKSEGVISGKEYEQIPPEELEALAIGQEIPVYVVNPEDQNGNLVLSYTRAAEEVSWQDTEGLLDNKETIHSSIIGYNKGGLIVPVGGLRGFVPASQISLSRRANLQGDTPETKWSKMIGQEIDVCVIEVDRERRRLILSERAASTETRESLKEKVIDELTEGETRVGRVTSLADFGAFVNISGADGLVHLSEISWERINHPGEVLKVGQEVKVRVISIDKDKKRIGLSIRQLQADPWAKEVAQYQVGQLVEGKITRLTKFGAFARLEGEIEGLIHISEISEKRIDHPKEVLHEGDVVALRVIKIDPDNHRIGLSLRRVESMAYADMDWQTLLETEEIADLDIEQEEAPVQEVEQKVVPAPAIEVQKAPVQEAEKEKAPVRAAKHKKEPAPVVEEKEVPVQETEPEEIPVPEAELKSADAQDSKDEPVEKQEPGSEEK
jgi:small subunit ribosomal protein S1